MYIQGFVVPVLPGKKEAYLAVAKDAGEMFRRYGALEIVEAFEDDISPAPTPIFARQCRQRMASISSSPG